VSNFEPFFRRTPVVEVTLRKTEIGLLPPPQSVDVKAAGLVLCSQTEFIPTAHYGFCIEAGAEEGLGADWAALAHLLGWLDDGADSGNEPKAPPRRHFDRNCLNPDELVDEPEPDCPPARRRRND
jgi:hypothetical protein